MSYSKTKLERRKTKYRNILTKTLDVDVIESSSNIIVICNGGLVNGITQEMIYETFQKYGKIDNILMIPEKSFSIVVYQNIDEANNAYTRLNGEIIWAEIKGPIYLCFLEKLPKCVDKSLNFTNNIPGLIILEDFITSEEENFILSVIDLQSASVSDQKSSELKHRKVKHYGYEFKYSTNNVDLNEPIKALPTELEFLWDRLSNHPRKNEFDFDFNFKPDQLTINCYEPGQGIPPHVDTHSAFEDGIFSLSLQSDIVMEFKHLNGKLCKVLLHRRSLCIMTGESRYDWTHCITPRKSDIVPSKSGGLTLQHRELRISLTFRKTRKGECLCKYPDLCDSQKKVDKTTVDFQSMSVKENEAAKLENNYVHAVYEKIATHFSETRHKPWPNVLKFIESFDSGSILLDVGCGNGKYFDLRDKLFEIGCDTSQNLMKVCRERGFECFTCNCLNIPMRDNIADGCISIAVIHHLATKERRKKAIEEMIRVTKPNGRILIYVWAKNQEIENEKSSYLKQQNQKNKEVETDCKQICVQNDNESITLPVHTNRTNFNHNDLLVPWKLKTKDQKVFLRFYHVFQDNELKDLCSETRNVKMLNYYYDQGNWCVILEKVS